MEMSVVEVLRLADPGVTRDRRGMEVFAYAAGSVECPSSRRSGVWGRGPLDPRLRQPPRPGPVGHTCQTDLHYESAVDLHDGRVDLGGRTSGLPLLVERLRAHI